MEEIVRIYENDIHTTQARRFFRDYYKELNLDEVGTDDDAQPSTESASCPDVSNHLISVVVPTFNRKEMLAKAVDSVLAQDYPKIEIIIINDCSTDGTFEYLTALSDAHDNIKIIHNETHKDPGYSRRLGYIASRGEYITFLDDDDYYIDNEFFKKAVQTHLAHQNLSFVGANAFIEKIAKGKLVTKNLNRTGVINKDDYLNNIPVTYNKPLSTFTSIFNKSNLDKVGFKDMFMMNDSSIYYRSLLTSDAYLLKDIIGVHVVHATNFSKNLDMEFIVKNVEEKQWVWEEAKKRNILLNPSWFANQVFLTFRYYIKGTQPNLKDYLYIMKWIMKNEGEGKWPLIFKISKFFARITYKLTRNWLGRKRRDLFTFTDQFTKTNTGQ